MSKTLREGFDWYPRTDAIIVNSILFDKFHYHEALGSWLSFSCLLFLSFFLIASSPVPNVPWHYALGRCRAKTPRVKHLSSPRTNWPLDLLLVAVENTQRSTFNFSVLHKFAVRQWDSQIHIWHLEVTCSTSETSLSCEWFGRLWSYWTQETQLATSVTWAR